MDKRTVLAIILSMAVLLIYQYFFVPPATEQTKTAPAGQKQAEQKDAAKEQATKPVPVPEVQAPATRYERELKVDTGLYSAVISTKGGTIKKWAIKNYKDNNGSDILLAPKDFVYPPLAIGANDSFDLAAADFSVREENLGFGGNAKTGSLVLEHSAGGYYIKRTYTFYKDSYQVGLKDEISGLPDYWLTLGTDFGISDKQDTSLHIGPVILKDAERIEFDEKKAAEGKTYREGLKWVAQEDKYFFSAIVPLNPPQEAKVWKVKGGSVVAVRGKEGVNDYIIYAGPKEHDRLKTLGAGLEHIIDFGFFSIIARPLFWILKFFYSFMGNYGLAIILLTIVTRIPFIPIINKGQRSMKKMQEIQPKIAELKEKYKKEPEKMQKEMMEIYKKYKINPMGGCLPMLLQIPVFFALYKVLMIAIELRGAPFMFWIKDLSQKDPYYVLPVIMGITMVLQQKMTPSSADPTQNKIMMFLPVIFTVMFLNFASGLVLYWLVNNILAIVQQFYANRSASQEPV